VITETVVKVRCNNYGCDKEIELRLYVLAHPSFEDALAMALRNKGWRSEGTIHDGMYHYCSFECERRDKVLFGRIGDERY